MSTNNGLIACVWLLAAVIGAADADGPAAEQTPTEKVDSACDLVVTAIAGTPGLSKRRDRGPFEAGPLALKFDGCRVFLSGSFAALHGAPDASARLRTAFGSAGWRELLDYGADGKDGTAFAFRNDGVRCFVVGAWNGGADGDPEIPPEDWYKVSVGCTNEVRGQGSSGPDDQLPDKSLDRPSAGASRAPAALRR